MAKKKGAKNIEVLADVQLLNEIQEAIEESTVESTLEESTDVETTDVETTEVETTKVEVVEEPKEEPVEEVFGEKDLVTFENNKGELRIGQYGYITKRGYKAIEKYKSQK
jgi:hypothetical protein